MERLSILGDYIDCQLYGNRLYLWTFGGSIRVYDYPKILKYLCGIRARFNQDHTCHQYEYEASQVYISDNELQHCLLYERDYLTSEFPTGTEVISNRLYETNAKGLYMSQIPLHDELHPSDQIWDCPLISISGAQRRGLVCAGGKDGLFWLPSSTNAQLVLQLSSSHTIEALFCDIGVYAHSSLKDAYLIKRADGHRYADSLMADRSLFPANVFGINHGRCLTWCWKVTFYFAVNHSLRVFKFSDLHGALEQIEQVHFFAWKGDFVSAGSADCGTVVELDNAICLFDDWEHKDGHCTTISGSVTRWRFYPRLYAFNNHVHIIFDERLDIVVMGSRQRPMMHYLERFGD